ncbi:hypothetical protein HWV62_40228 [Athelia sp. TMB]|nr:hypothetical protein HWV62_40228 [Athelia sp. TMB]
MPLIIDKGLIRHLWAQQTFTTRAKTEQLLSPELEPAGTLTVGDFEKAVDFYPGEQRRLPGFYGVTFTAVASLSVYGLVSMRRRRWPIRKASLAGFLGLFNGVAYGQYKQLQANVNFKNSLEDREGFLKAFNKVYEREGGLSALVKDKRAEAIDREIIKGSSIEDDAINLIKKRGVPSESSLFDVQKSNPAIQHTDVWDATDLHSQTARAGKTAEEERALAQAEFDAMLEKERRGAD